RDRDRRYAVPVHGVDGDPVGPGGGHRSHLVREPAEVRGEDRWSDVRHDARLADAGVGRQDRKWGEAQPRARSRAAKKPSRPWRCGSGMRKPEGVMVAAGGGSGGAATRAATERG